MMLMVKGRSSCEQNLDIGLKTNLSLLSQYLFGTVIHSSHKIKHSIFWDRSPFLQTGSIDTWWCLDATAAKAPVSVCYQTTWMHFFTLIYSMSDCVHTCNVCCLHSICHMYNTKSWQITDSRPSLVIMRYSYQFLNNMTTDARSKFHTTLSRW